MRIRGWVAFNPALRKSFDSITATSCFLPEREPCPVSGPRRERVSSPSLSPVYVKPPMRTLLLTAAAVVSLSGCLYRQPVYQGNLVEEAAVKQLAVGMSKEQVMSMMGSPSIADPFHKDRWDYTATQRVGRGGKTEIKNFVVYFENNAVTKWEGDYFPEQDDALAKRANKEFGPNLRKSDKEKRGGE